MVRGRGPVAKIGVFAAGTHRVVDIPHCEIHHPLVNEVALELKAAMRRLGASCYDEVRHQGLVRAVQVVVERSSQTAQVVVICNDREPGAALPLLAELERRVGSRLHSLWWNGNAERTNRVLGRGFVHIRGPECVVERIGGASVFFPPGAFGQNNLEMFDRIVAAIHALVPPDRHVVELFAGTGGIGLGLAARARSLTFNEIGPDSLSGLDLGIAALDPALHDRIQVVRGPAIAARDAIREDSFVIADPPRKGLGAELLSALAERTPERLLYVSCGLESFLRDSVELCSAGLQLESAAAYDVFPYTHHIETLAVFRRERG